MGTETVNADRLVQILEDVAQTVVLDVRHPGFTGLTLPDTDYWTVIFSAKTCPTVLRGYTSRTLPTPPEDSPAPTPLDPAEPKGDDSGITVVRRRRRPARKRDSPRNSYGGLHRQRALPAPLVEGASIGAVVQALSAPVEPSTARTHRPKAPTTSPESSAVQRYRATLEAYQSLAAGEDSDSDDDRDDAPGETQGTVLSHVPGPAGGTLPYDSPFGELGQAGTPRASLPQERMPSTRQMDDVSMVEEPENQPDAPTTEASAVSPGSAPAVAPSPVSSPSSIPAHKGRTGAPTYEDQDFDMCDATVDRGPHYRAGPPTGTLKEEGATPNADPGVFTNVHSPASETDPSQEPF
ncbi:unnamed protein product [Phytophthora fragariaefolia]|uniref:Unnamed protein product n=1 Tax=Phytophthora fragariaefolia TaxID=1490495 RepID=A0A9W6TRS0_9STRA|nr:unnamed protein product [Phytophthora fragariaefolia]